MWQKLVTAHRQLEDRILALMLTPPPADAALSPVMARFACRIRQMSDAERRHMADFARRNRGWAGYRRWLVQPMLAFSLLGLALHWLLPQRFSPGGAVLLCNVIGLAFGFGLIVTWFNHRKFARFGLADAAKLIALASLGALVGASMGIWADGRSVVETLLRIGRTVVIAGVGVGGFYALLVGAVSRIRARALEQDNRRLEQEAEAERLARQLSDAQLRLLQAQIEPHFLFNTLGAVQQLAEDGAPRAAELTADLIQFLRSSLVQMRSETVTLAEDFALVGAYLRVMQARLGSRLSFTLSLPDALYERQVPTMMLLTLVENAIKHGIEPALRGGTITVSAIEADGVLRVIVADDGVGLSDSPHDGVGLQNIRDRLRLAYGERAGVALAPCEGGGASATLWYALAA
jgi:signal transduction histidine kinase